MTPEIAHGVNIDVCSACGGIWLSGDQLKALITSDAKTVQEIEATVHPAIEHQKVGPSQLQCPCDSSQMDEYHYLYNSPVLIHACGACGGVFIHAQDLPLMQQWFDHSQQPMTKEETLKVQVGMDEAQHQAFMLRQQHLQGFFSTLSRYCSGWIGLI